MITDSHESTPFDLGYSPDIKDHGRRTEVAEPSDTTTNQEQQYWIPGEPLVSKPETADSQMFHNPVLAVSAGAIISWSVAAVSGPIRSSMAETDQLYTITDVKVGLVVGLATTLGVLCMPPSQ